MRSVFLQLPASAHVASNALAFAIRDKYPVSEGHTLVIPRRLVPDWFSASPDEQAALLALVDEVKAQLDAAYQPDGYNVGFNAGVAAGQTVMHLHVHVIPRYHGDMADPRGGVRHVIPEKGNYLRQRARALSTGRASPLLDALRPLLREADEIDVVAAFVRSAGVREVAPAFWRTLARGGRVRVLTGDYLHYTEPAALDRLLRMGRRAEEGALELRVIEVDAEAGHVSFHPKSWRLGGPAGGVGFVGSSNLTRLALTEGTEWNLRLEQARDPEAYAELCRAFEGLWSEAREVDEGWLREYAERVRTRPPPPPPDGQDKARPLQPRALQQEALDALEAARAQGRRRALVVMATGLGKTFLAVFDALRVRALALAEGRPGRILVLAHREELLEQALGSFAKLSPGLSQGRFFGDHDQLDTDLVAASVQKLGRPGSLRGLDPAHFDYVIVDEAHHAAASSWRRALGHLEPRFLLGLTATPDRADAQDILPLFDDFEAFRADLAVGMESLDLVPFRYIGLADPTDFAPIPWRSGRFSVEALTEAVQTEARMQKLAEALGEHPGRRTLFFCCSIRHAEFVRDRLQALGLRAAALHSAPGSDDRAASLRALADGELDALCAVDLLNEGVDVPDVDRVVMLRPTESPVVFLQQLGRGLRTAPGKRRLLVLDFIGNHHVFLNRLRTLLSLEETPRSLRQALGEPGPLSLELPEGCAVELELAAVDLLRELLPRGSKVALRETFEELRVARGERPQAVEMLSAGEDLRGLAEGHWFAFLRDMHALSPPEQRALAAAEPWLAELFSTGMSKCFKMVVVQALLDADALAEGLPLDTLAQRSHARMLRSPELFEDIRGNERHLGDPRDPDPERWQAYWDRWPVKAWVEGHGTGGARGFFDIEGEALVPQLPWPEDAEAREALVDMTQELVTFRLARYRGDRRLRQGLALEVFRHGQQLALRLPNGPERSRLPASGQAPVLLPDGTRWRARFRALRIDALHRAGDDRDALADTLRRWFGPRPEGAQVQLSLSRKALHLSPHDPVVLSLTHGEALPTYPTLRAAADVEGLSQAEDLEREAVRLPGPVHPGDFALRASGDSMNGGPTPIRDGDWLILRWARGARLDELRDRVALFALGDPTEGPSHHLKRLAQTPAGRVLRSDNPEVPDLPVGAQVEPIARLVRVVRPESLAPPLGSLVGDLQRSFSLSEAPAPGLSRLDGHAFLLLAPEEAAPRSPLGTPTRPGETAFTFRAEGERWRYLGLSRRSGLSWTTPPES
ncbi:MAG: DEAD/DEAH box helicase family protein [Alphaproteobacteria bacterium]|nr:DEAD/DEAH box helicase family protein [Alphaproteobacteria bacterium]MCB9794750.1 DEAD/DEAH box helicase family protein [Alphaproteobacteria bacterium]